METVLGVVLQNLSFQCVYEKAALGSTSQYLASVYKQGLAKDCTDLRREISKTLYETCKQIILNKSAWFFASDQGVLNLILSNNIKQVVKRALFYRRNSSTDVSELKALERNLALVDLLSFLPTVTVFTQSVSTASVGTLVVLLEALLHEHEQALFEDWCYTKSESIRERVCILFEKLEQALDQP